MTTPRPHSPASRLLLGLLPAALSITPARADEPRVSIADLAEYRAALGAAPPAAPTPATFGELYEHPEAYRGRPVAVAGRVARLFRQPGVGQFPPLAEAWITSPRGEPTCLVFPAGPDRAVPGPGAEVRFAGTFLRRIAYPGGDAERIAPLVVGPAPPVAAAPGATAPSFGPIFGGDRALDWAVGLIAAAGVGLALFRRHLAGPPAPPPRPVDPAPSFLDGDGLGPGPAATDPPDFGGSDHDDR